MKSTNIWIAFTALLVSGTAKAQTRVSNTVYLSEKTWASATNGWGPVERNMSNGEQPSRDGRTITLNGVTYGLGLGVHAPSEVRYHLGGGCSTFTADVGVDDEVASRGTVVFEVWADGTRLYSSGVMNGSTTSKRVDLNVAGKNELRLVVSDGGDGINSDHADWASAKLICGADTTPPAITNFAPLNGATNVAPESTIKVTFSESLKPATISEATLQLMKQSSVPVTATVSYNIQTRIATLKPASVVSM